MSTPELIKKNQMIIQNVAEATQALRTELAWDARAHKPRVAVVLGSGLGLFCDALTNKRTVSFENIPHLPASTVPGHAAHFVVGTTQSGVCLLVAQGRVHAYEGHASDIVTLPIRMMAALGIQHVLLTNAAGSINPNYRPGDFVLLDDHINLTGQSPLTGVFDDALGTRFVDLSEPYVLSVNVALQKKCAADLPDVTVHRGVYMGLSGPSYETPAEVRMLGKLGGDVVGMSTVYETIVAKQCGLKVNGISCVTNLGSGLGTGTLNHMEVADMGKKRAGAFCAILEMATELL